MKTLRKHTRPLTLSLYFLCFPHSSIFEVNIRKELRIAFSLRFTCSILFSFSFSLLTISSLDSPSLSLSLTNSLHTISFYTRIILFIPCRMLFSGSSRVSVKLANVARKLSKAEKACVCVSVSILFFSLRLPLSSICLLLCVLCLQVDYLTSHTRTVLKALVLDV